MTDSIMRSSISVFVAFNDVRSNQSLVHDNPILNHSEALLIFSHIEASIRSIRALKGNTTGRSRWTSLGAGRHGCRYNVRNIEATPDGPRRSPSRGTAGMDISRQKEQFNKAYVRAIAAQAGFNPSELEVDDDSVDFELSGRGFVGLLRNPKVQFQLKCTSQDLVSGDVIKFPLPRKNYDDLRGNDVVCPRYLAVLLVPEEPAMWVEHHPEHMRMLNACFYVSLRDLPDTANTSTVTVDVPLAQRLTTESLRHLMTLASNMEIAS